MKKTHDLLPAPAVELGSAILHTLAKVGDKWGDRDQLNDGATYRMQAQLAGSINGHPFSMPIDATLTVGHESNRAASVTPHVNDILAILLSFLPAELRGDVIDYVLDEYKSSGDLKANDEQLAQVDELLSQMRRVTTVPVRGSVKVNTATKDSPLSISAA